MTRTNIHCFHSKPCLIRHRVKKQQNIPHSLESLRGEAFSLAALISSANMCNQLLTQLGTIKFSAIKGIDETRLKLNELQFPFLAFDGIGSFILGGALLVLSTVTKNHHGRIIACAPVHSEQLTATEALE